MFVNATAVVVAMPSNIVECWNIGSVLVFISCSDVVFVVVVVWKKIGVEIILFSMFLPNKIICLINLHSKEVIKGLKKKKLE